MFLVAIKWRKWPHKDLLFVILEVRFTLKTKARENSTTILKAAHNCIFQTSFNLINIELFHSEERLREIFVEWGRSSFVEWNFNSRYYWLTLMGGKWNSWMLNWIGSPVGVFLISNAAMKKKNLKTNRIQILTPTIPSNQGMLIKQLQCVVKSGQIRGIFEKKKKKQLLKSKRK